MEMEHMGGSVPEPECVAPEPEPETGCACLLTESVSRGFVFTGVRKAGDLLGRRPHKVYGVTCLIYEPFLNRGLWVARVARAV